MKLVRPRTDNEIKKLSLTALKLLYRQLAEDYKKFLNHQALTCFKCGEILSDDNFYYNKDYEIGKFPICKSCIQKMVAQQENETDKPNETKESVQKVLHLMNRVYDDAFYTKCVEEWKTDTRENKRRSPFATYIATIQAVPAYRDLTWENSSFGSEGNIVDKIDKPTKKARKEMKKIFGNGYSDSDYLYLQDQYDDWRTRVEINTKSQETYLIQICLQLLDIDKSRKTGKEVTNKLKALDQLMASANLQPKQNVGNTSTDGLTFGQLIEKWELEEPIPEPEEEFKDVDGIGKYLKTWFGWIAKAVGIENSYTKQYEDEIKKYTVKKPSADLEDNSLSVYNKLFGENKNG